MTTTLIGATVEKQLDDTLWKLITGELALYDLTPALAGHWTLAYDQGRESMRPRIERLEYLVDYWWWIASNRGKTGADFNRACTDQLWAEAVTS